MQNSLYKTSLLFIFFGSIASTFAQDRPNILWLTTEDMSANHLSCYGNIDISTPNIDAFAAKGIRYTNAFSNGPQCSPARTSLINGMYSTTLMAEWHRKERVYPYQFFYPLILRNNGYYCTNSGKTDYNSEYDKGSLAMDIWNSNSVSSLDKLSVPSNKPFFTVINFYETHMSRITEYDSGGTMYNNRKFTRANPATVHFTNYLPHTDTIKSDMAYHLEKTLELDTWFGNQMTILKNKGLADNTIVFFYSDHGGCLPGSKGYIRDEGVRVPLIVYFPEKWKHLAPQLQPGISDRLVCFADFAPTIYSMLGINKPSVCQGKAFAGPKNETPHDYIFLYKANQELNFIPARGVTDTKFKFIWNYNTAFCSGGRNDFQWGMPGLRDWEMKYRNGELENNPQWHSYFWQPMAAFELYDLKNDPDETNNLAYLPEYADTLSKYKAALQRIVRETNDLGFFPESMRDTMNTYEKLLARKYNIERLVSTAEFSSTANSFDVDSLVILLKNPDPVIRYWAAMGFFQLSRNNKISTLPGLVEQKASNSNENGEVRAACAAAMVYKGNACKGLNVLLEYSETNFGKAILQNIEDKAKPLMRTYWNNFTSGKNGFYPRSILINGGVIPYSSMFGNVARYDTTMFATDILLQPCKPQACPALHNDDFNSGTQLPTGWSEVYTTNQVYIKNQKLELFFSPAISAKPLAKRVFAPVSGVFQFKFTFNTSRSTMNAPVTLRNSESKPIAMISFNGGIKLVTSIDADENPLSFVNMIPENNVPKGIDHEISFIIDTETDKQTLIVNNAIKAEASNVNLLTATNNIASFEVYNKYMWNGAPSDLGYVYIDNFEVKANPTDISKLLSEISNTQKLLDSTLVSIPCNHSTQSWISLSDSLYYAQDAANHCDISSYEASSIADRLHQLTNIYSLNHETTIPTSILTYSVDNQLAVNVGKTLFFKTKIEPADVCNRDVIWESSDTTVASIDFNGLLSAKKAGKVSVKATSIANNSISNSVQIEVSSIVSEVKLMKSNSIIYYRQQFEELVISPSLRTRYKYEVFSVSGQPLKEGTATGNAIIRLNGIQNGIYILLLTHENIREIKKFVKK